MSVFVNPVLTNGEKLVYCVLTIEHLIKSGGGNGPMKPGNLRKRKVPNPAVKRKMRLYEHFDASRLAGRVSCVMGPHTGRIADPGFNSKKY